MNGPTLPIVQGTSRDFQLQANPITGDPYSVTNPSPYVLTDVLSTDIWAGKGQPVLLSPGTAWIDVASAIFQIALNDADTASLTPGRYRILTTASRSGRSSVILDGWLEIASAPGIDATSINFTTYDDLLLYAHWLEDLLTEEDESAYIQHQRRATNRLIDALVMQWKPDQWQKPYGYGHTVLQWSSGYAVAPPIYWLRQQLVPLVPNSVLPSNLPARQPFGSQANFIDSRVSTALLLYDEVKEVCAKWAIAYILKDQLGKGEGGVVYRNLAREYAAEAGSLYRSRRFEIDLGNPQTGYAWFLIDGGATSLR